MEHKQRVHELNVKIGIPTNKITCQKMDFDTLYSEMHECLITRPLQQAVERICSKIEDFVTVSFMEPSHFRHHHNHHHC